WRVSSDRHRPATPRLAQAAHHHRRDGNLLVALGTSFMDARAEIFLALMYKSCYNVTTYYPLHNRCLFMIKKLSKHGNSLALVMDRSILDLLHIDEKTSLNISTDGE